MNVLATRGIPAILAVILSALSAFAQPGEQNREHERHAGHTHKHPGTLQRAGFGIGGKCGFSDITQHELGLLLSGRIAALRRSTQHMVISPAGHFAIHFDTSGPHAVPTLDVDSNGIPDYVDSTAYYFDHAWQVEIEELGYAPPPGDNMGGGTAEYDVYILDLQEIGVYGVTHPESQISARGGTDGRWRTYIEIDNNFSPTDSTGIIGQNRRRTYYETGYRALRVTAAHEFHHAIQLGAYGSIRNRCALHEFTSTWMEYRLHPDVRDYEQFIPYLFRRLAEITFGNAACATGYNYGIVGQMLHNEYGEEVILRMWEMILDEVDGYRSLNNALAEKGADMRAAWYEFAAYLYYTNYRAQDGKYLTRAATYPTVDFHDVIAYEGQAILRSGSMRAFEQRFIRIVLPPAMEGFTADTLDIALMNVDLDAAASGSARQESYSIAVSKNPQSSEPIAIPGTPYYLEQYPANNKIALRIFFNSGFLTRNRETPFPNPFVPGMHEELYFPVAGNIESASAEAVLTIYTDAMDIVYSQALPVEFREGYIVVRWPGTNHSGDTPASGVYIFSVEHGDDARVGKFAIKHRE